MCGIYGMVATARRCGIPRSSASWARRCGIAGRTATPSSRAPRRAIGTERLRIIDLHERADQPFAAPGSQVWLECNGEIYNAAEIRARYPDYPYRSKSDVETILPLYLERGVAAIPELDGMFGLAIWDARTQTLILARDRAGEKPLFYAKAGARGDFRVGAAMPAAASRHQPRARSDRHRRVPAPRIHPRAAHAVPRRPPRRGGDVRSISSKVTSKRFATGIRRRSASNAISARAAIDETQRLDRARGRKAGDVRRAGRRLHQRRTRLLDPGHARGEVHRRRSRCTRTRRRSRSSRTTRVRCAEELAKRIRTRYVPVRTDARDAAAKRCRASSRGVAEPLADPAILPTFLLARAARQHVKVILSGEGADELFGGYPTYLGHKIAPIYDAMPSFVRAMLRRLVQRVPSSTKKVTLEFLLKRFVSDAEKPWIERHWRWFGTGLAPTVYKLASELPDLPPSNGDRARRRDAARLPQLSPRQPAGESRPRHDAVVGRSARAVPRSRRHPFRAVAPDRSAPPPLRDEMGPEESGRDAGCRRT